MLAISAEVGNRRVEDVLKILAKLVATLGKGGSRDKKKQESESSQKLLNGHSQPPAKLDADLSPMRAGGRLNIQIVARDGGGCQPEMRDFRMRAKRRTREPTDSQFF